jgi:quercetin dioxygenase-like cupin family protein
MSEAPKVFGPTLEPQWPWPDRLDAVLAAPRHHRVVFENDRVRVLDTRIAPGDTVPIHTHRWPAANQIKAAS